MPSNSFHLLFNQISNEAVGQVHLKVLSRWLAFHVARRKVYIQSRAGHATMFSLRDNYNSTTTWQRNRASVTKQNTKIVWLRCPNGVASHNECRHNNKQLFGLKTWSRCRGSVVECPALYICPIDNTPPLYSDRKHKKLKNCKCPHTRHQNFKCKRISRQSFVHCPKNNLNLCIQTVSVTGWSRCNGICLVSGPCSSCCK